MKKEQLEVIKEKVVIVTYYNVEGEFSIVKGRLTSVEEEKIVIDKQKYIVIDKIKEILVCEK